jgi:hypothetical protein
MLHESRNRLHVLREQQLALQENINELETLERIALQDLHMCSKDVESSYQDYLSELILSELSGDEPFAAQ